MKYGNQKEAETLRWWLSLLARETVESFMKEKAWGAGRIRMLRSLLSLKEHGHVLREQAEVQAKSVDKHEKEGWGPAIQGIECQE